MRRGAASMMRRTTFCDRPARGGSMMQTSGRLASLDELAQREAHVAGEEARVVDLVALGVGDRVGDRLLDDLQAPHLAGAGGEAQADGADPAVQVEDALPALEVGELGGDRVELLGHLGVRLKERLRRDREAQARRSPPRACGAPAMTSVSPPCVVSASASVRVHISPSQSTAAARASVSSSPGTGDEPHLQLARAPALAHDEVAQQARRACGGHRRQALLATPGQRPARGRRCERSEASRQSVTGDDLVPRARRVEAADERAVVGRAERVLELVAVAPRLDGGDDRRRARSPRDGRSASARRATCSCLTASWRS